jgi:hypothetical protein
MRAAGLLLTDGTHFVKLERAAGYLDPVVAEMPFADGRSLEFPALLELGPPVSVLAYHLRLRRRGDEVTLEFKEGELARGNWPGGPRPLPWCRACGPVRLPLPRKVKVGVVAEASAEGTFKAVFEQFKLTPLGGRPATRPVDAGH